MSNAIRFTGLASGFDTETMITQLMKAERMKVDAVFQKKEWASWKRDSYRSVNTQFLAFRNIVSDLRLQGTFMAKKVASSNTDVATAKGSGAAANFSYDLKVEQLAQNAYANSKGSIEVQVRDIDGNPMVDGEGNPVMTFNAKDKNFLAAAAGIGSGESKEFKINGKTFKVEQGKSLEDLVRKYGGKFISVSSSMEIEEIILGEFSKKRVLY